MWERAWDRAAVCDADQVVATVDALVYIEPGSPWESPFVESLNGRVSDELLPTPLLPRRQDPRLARQGVVEAFTWFARGRAVRRRRAPAHYEQAKAVVSFTYEGEGAQLTRTDALQTAGPSGGACGDAGVSCVTQRSTTHAYNPDATLRSSVSTDAAGQTLTTCHTPAPTPPPATTPTSTPSMCAP